MKLTIFIVFLFLIQILPVDAFSQNTLMSLNIKSAPIKDVLEKIEEKSEFVFLYNIKLIDVNRTVSINVKDQKISEILDKLFQDTEVIYTVIGRQIVLTNSYDEAGFAGNKNQQRQKTVSGKVTDISGASVSGASVAVKNTSHGTLTDSNGNYSISGISDDAILQFSFVGMKMQYIPVGNKTTVNVKLEEDQIGIEEVIAIGYGSIKRQDLISSISMIYKDAIESRPITALGEAFAGQLAGIRTRITTGIPGAEPQIRVRGVNTINGNSNPLYVIDGVPRDQMTDINPNDIASIQVLKDASSTAIYGSRGANGVILIETKQGSGEPSFSFESFYGLQTREKKMDMMNKNEWLAFNIYVRNVQWLREGGSMKDPMSSRRAGLQIPDSWLDESNKGTDWQDAIMGTAPVQSYQLSASAKSDLGSMFISGGYLDQNGIIYNTYYRRMNFRFNGTLDVSDRIKIGVFAAPSFSDKDDRESEGKELAIHHALNEPPLVPINSATRDWGYPTGLEIVFPNPLEQLKETTNNTRLNTINTSVWGQVDILKGLTFKSQYSFDKRNSTWEFFQPGNVTYNNGYVSIGKSNSEAWTDMTLQNTLIFDKVHKNYAFNVLFGQSIEEHDYFRIDAVATGWSNDNVSTLNVAITPTTASTTKSKSKGASFFGRTSLSIQDKYLFNASLRYDGSSRFGSNNKWGVFPAMAVGWKMNKEPFLKDVKWINLMKIRAATGKAGNDRIGDFSYLSILQKDNASWGGDIVSGFAPANIENPYLKWEATKTTDIGIDFTGFKNRLQLSFDYYNDITDNLLFSLPVPNTTGYDSFTTNLGSVENKGWEVDLTTRNTLGKFVKWTTSINLSKEANKVLDMGNITQFTSNNFDALFVTRVGGPVSQYYVYRTNGILSTSDFDSNNNALVPILSGEEPGDVKYVDQNGDEKINASDLVPYGNNIPDLIYGMTNLIQYKDFELSVLIQGQIGGDVCFLGQRHLDFGGWDKNQFSRWIHSWKPDFEAIYGTGENPVPAIEGVDMSWDGKTPNVFGTVDNNYDLRIYDTSFFRVKNITFTYTLPQKFLLRTFLKSAKIYTSIDNLLTIDNYPGYTPETNSFGNSTTQAGVDYATYPLSKKYTLGIKINF